MVYSKTVAFQLCALLGFGLGLLVHATESEVCQWQEFQAKCPDGHVIIMQHAIYGRMQYGRCIKRDYGYVGCSTDVLGLADLRCSGQRSCTINVPDKLFDKTKPCPEDLKMYLAANYTCEKVVQPPNKKCRGGVPTEVTSSSGYLASIVTKETGCGSTSTPWKIKVPQGQRINVSLLDFGRHHPNRSSTTSDPYPHCHVYAILKENGPAAQKSETVCGGVVTTQRRTEIYTSRGHELEVRLVAGKVANREDMGQFVIAYEAFGCADLSESPNTIWKRNGNKAEMSCHGNEQIKWQLTCVGNEWKGDHGNCSELDAAKTGFTITALHRSMVSLSHGSSLLIIVVVALFIGIAILLVGLIIIKRRHIFTSASSRRTPIPQSYHQKDLPYIPTTKNGMILEAHPPLLSRQDTFIYSTEENEYAYVDELQFHHQHPQHQFQQQQIPLHEHSIPQSPHCACPPNQEPPKLLANPYETTRHVSPEKLPMTSSSSSSAAPKSCDRTGTGSVTSHARSHDKSRELPPQYFVLDPEALDEDGIEEVNKASVRVVDNSNQYT